jgi:Carbohydrate-binding family 9
MKLRQQFCLTIQKTKHSIDQGSFVEVPLFLIMKNLVIATIYLLIFNACLFTGCVTGQLLVSINDSIKSNGQKTVEMSNDTLIVRKCRDFNLTGSGNHIEWGKAVWHLLTKLDSGERDYESRFKILYSGKGIYLLFNGEDEKIATQSDQDFGNIYEGDAFEVFFHTNPLVPKYFEYEINQLNKELILVITKVNNKGYLWAPWHYENAKQIYRIVDIVGGKMEKGSSIRSWSAEIFLPFDLLDLLANVPPLSGTVWNANFCRLDYDSGKMIKWSWSPRVRNSFHELEAFRSIKFE